MRLVIYFFFPFLIISCGPKDKPVTNGHEEITINKSNRNIKHLDYSKNDLLGKTNPLKNTSFTKISTKHTQKNKIFLRTEVYVQFIKMYDAAKKESLDLNIVSAFRSFYDQKRIWEAKWTGKRNTNGINLAKSGFDDYKKALTILKYSSMPGTSRHHWGTDIDLVHLSNDYFLQGKGLKTYIWLQTNASKYGFYQVYTAKDLNRPNGYNEEKWHWTYLPLSQTFLKQYLSKISYSNLKGFEGDKTAVKIDVINKYVKGINKQCFIPLQKK